MRLPLSGGSLCLAHYLCFCVSIESAGISSLSQIKHPCPTKLKSLSQFSPSKLKSGRQATRLHARGSQTEQQKCFLLRFSSCCSVCSLQAHCQCIALQFTEDFAWFKEEILVLPVYKQSSTQKLMEWVQGAPQYLSSILHTSVSVSTGALELNAHWYGGCNLNCAWGAVWIWWSGCCKVAVKSTPTVH